MPSWEWSADGQAVTIAGATFRIVKDRLQKLPSYSIELARSLGGLKIIEKAVESMESGGAPTYADAYRRAGELSLECQSAVDDLDRIRQDIAQFFDPPIDWAHFTGAEALAQRFQTEAYEMLVRANG